MKYLFLYLIIFNNLLFSQGYPSKAIEFIVGLGEGGSADRMTRNMAYFLEKELNVHIKIKNIPHNASVDAANFVLKQASDGYTIFSSTFSPYLPNAILSKKVDFTMDDFEIINLQWFEQDFIAVNKNSKFNTILELISHIKTQKKKLNIAVINRSSGHILFKLLLEKLNIPFDRVNLKLYEGGKKARKALLSSKVDVLVIAAQGSEKYREDIKPLAIASSKRSKRWDAPTLNEVLKPLNINLPNINGPIRGFAVSKKFKENYPYRFKTLQKAIRKTLSKKSVQQKLKSKRIGHSWIGSEQSKQILQNSFEKFKKYYYLIDD